MLSASECQRIQQSVSSIYFNGIGVQCVEQIGTFHASCWQVVQYNSSFPAFEKQTASTACLFELHLCCLFDGEIRSDAAAEMCACATSTFSCCDVVKCGRSGAKTYKQTQNFAVCIRKGIGFYCASTLTVYTCGAAFCPTSWKRAVNEE